MPQRKQRILVRVVCSVLLLLLFVTEASAQCVDSSEVNDYEVRTVTFRSLFGATPAALKKQLDGHRGEAYSARRASLYINEIRTFLATDADQQKYEELIANKLKLSIKAGRTWLECVQKIAPTECQASVGTTRCVDVKIRRYFVDVDALDSSPYLLLFPRSALAALYGAMPRWLLALNPALNGQEDTRFGPSASIDTASDVLDLAKIFSHSKSTTQPKPTNMPVSISNPDDQLEITTAPASSGPSPTEEPALDLAPSNLKLLLRLQARRSLVHDFYDSSSSLILERTRPLKTVQNLALKSQFEAAHLPQGQGDYLKNAATVALISDLRFKRGPVSLLSLSGGYRWSRNRSPDISNTSRGGANSENSFDLRATIDGKLANGLLRAAFWADGGAITGEGSSYQRVATLVGYAKNFVLARKKVFHEIAPSELGGRSCWTSFARDPTRNDPTIGVEILAGAGHAWGHVPEYDRFYGGSRPGEFLYDELAATKLTAFPSGPILRSQGQRQAGASLTSTGGVRGGLSFWHLNANVSIPVSKWSRPLIPHEWVTASTLRDDDVEFQGHIPAGAAVCRDLKSTIKTLVGISGINLMVNQQARDLLSDAQKRDLRLRNKDPRTPEEEARLNAAEKALSQAKSQVRPEVETIFARDILPITNFIADHANMIAVKPLLMFDVAQIALGDVNNRTRYAAGAGLQIDVVLARFELGYLAALNRFPGDRRGSMVGRLVLKRFF